MAQWALTDEGDFIIDNSGNIAFVDGQHALIQNYKSEVRCEQNTFPPLPEFGRNPLIWKLSQSKQDRIDDLTRIGNKYVYVQAVTEQNNRYTIVI